MEMRSTLTLVFFQELSPPSLAVATPLIFLYRIDLVVTSAKTFHGNYSSAYAEGLPWFDGTTAYELGRLQKDKRSCPTFSNS
jgi:hypothetical protein